MLSRKKLLRAARLYLILDTQVNTYDELFEISRKAAKAGVDVLQLRDKGGSARSIIRFSQRLRKILPERVLYIINDRVDLALVSQADGAHLGQEDMPLTLARKIMGREALIGLSCQEISHVREAKRLGVDYIGFGSVFKTLTKPSRKPMDLSKLVQAYRISPVPVFAIGGIKAGNLDTLTALGVKRVAVCREICLAKNVQAAVDTFQSKLNKN